MAVSRHPDNGRTNPRAPDIRDRLPGLSRYDYVLAVIPVAFVLAAVFHVIAGVSLQLTLLPTSLVGILLLIDVVFLNPPITEGGRP